MWRPFLTAEARFCHFLKRLAGVPRSFITKWKPQNSETSSQAKAFSRYLKEEISEIALFQIPPQNRGLTMKTVTQNSLSSVPLTHTQSDLHNHILCVIFSVQQCKYKMIKIPWYIRFLNNSNAWILYNLKATRSTIMVNERELLEHIAWWDAH